MEKSKVLELIYRYLGSDRKVPVTYESSENGVFITHPTGEILAFAAAIEAESSKELAEAKATITELEIAAEARDAKIASMADGSLENTCGCSYDSPSDICSSHSPMLKQAEKELAAAHAQIESLVKATDPLVANIAAAQAEIVRLREGLQGIGGCILFDGDVNINMLIMAARNTLASQSPTQALDQAIAQAVEPYKRDAEAFRSRRVIGWMRGRKFIDIPEQRREGDIPVFDLAIRARKDG